MTWHMPHVGWLGAAFVLCLLISAFCSASETALMALNRYRIKHLANAGHPGARRIQTLLRRPDRFLGAVLVSNTFGNVAGSALFTVLILHFFPQDLGLPLGSLCLTLMVFVFAELLPKTWATHAPETLALRLSWCLVQLQRLVSPVLWLSSGITRCVLSSLGLDLKPLQADKLNIEEIKTLIHESRLDLTPSNANLLIRMLELRDSTVDDLMIPRHDVVGINLDDPWPEILAQLTHSPHTRLPLFSGDLDNLHGVLHLRNMVHALTEHTLTPHRLKQLADQPYCIPQGTPLIRQLLLCQTTAHLGFVVDEYGGIQGMITLDDILRDMVNELSSTPVTSSKWWTHVAHNTWLVDGTASIRMLNRTLDWSLPTQQAKTLGGLIMSTLERIPKAGASVQLGDLQCQVLVVQDNCPKQVRVHRVEPAPQTGGDPLEPSEHRTHPDDHSNA